MRRTAISTSSQLCRNRDTPSEKFRFVDFGSRKIKDLHRAIGVFSDFFSVSLAGSPIDFEFGSDALQTAERLLLSWCRPMPVLLE
ncbi:MAG: hypothetical protein WCF62_18445, partial [Pseudolabrys sp.]